MKKINFNKKIVVLIAVGIITLGISIFIICIKLSNPYKPAFYVYSSYVDKQTVKNIDKKYSLKEYQDANAFDYAISNQKAIAGITSDYLIINLIKEGKISPISKEIKEINELEFEIDSYFSDETQDQMKKYDYGFEGYKGLINDEETQKMLQEKYPEYGNYKFKMSDFIVPYFINDRVYAFDSKKILNQTFAPGTNINPLNFNTKNINNQCIPEAETTEEVLEKIIKSSKSPNVVIQWIKNEIENSVIGSEWNNGVFSTSITEENYKNLVNNFSNIVKKGTGHSISDNKANIFESDSDVILNNLINPSSRIKAAVLYNGDALDAYYGNDNFSDIEDGDRLRIIRTKNNVRILDAFVVSSDVSSNQRKDLLNFFNQQLFNNMFKSKKDLEKENEILKKDNKSIFETNGIMRIFDYVNYTPAAKGAFEFIVESDYFKTEDGNVDKVALNIFTVGKNGTPIAPVDKQTFSKLSNFFQKKLNG